MDRRGSVWRSFDREIFEGAAAANGDGFVSRAIQVDRSIDRLRDWTGEMSVVEPTHFIIIINKSAISDASCKWTNATVCWLVSTTMLMDAAAPSTGLMQRVVSALSAWRVKYKRSDSYGTILSSLSKDKWLGAVLIVMIHLNCLRTAQIKKKLLGTLAADLMSLLYVKVQVGLKNPKL